MATDIDFGGLDSTTDRPLFIISADHNADIGWITELAKSTSLA